MPVVGTISPAAGPVPSRGSRTQRAVLDATAALMAEGGLAAATIDAIRDRSGVSKTTIYKHWPNRLCVAVDAFAERLASDASLPDTGTARGDFREQVIRVSAFYASPVGSVFAQLLASAMQDPVASQWLRTRSWTVASGALRNCGTGQSRAARFRKTSIPTSPWTSCSGPSCGGW